MMKISLQRIKEIIFSFVLPVLAVVLPALVYVCYRAYNLSFTHDESLSFFTSNNDATFAMAPNNHLLNTLMMKVFGTLFGISEFSLRLPNVLAFVLFCIAGLAIIKSLKKPGLAVFYLAILVFNPLMMEFFGLARGYGLSMGLAMASFYFLFKLSNNSQPASKYFLFLILCLVFSQFSLYANLNALNLHLALLAVLITGVVLYFRTNFAIINRKLWIPAFSAVLTVDIAALLPAIFRLRMLQEAKELAVFGDHLGFLKTTLQSLITSFYYHEQDFPGTFHMIYYSVIGLFALACVWFLYTLYKRTFTNFSKIFLILCLLVAAPVLQELIFNIPFPSGRTAILYFPVFSLLIILLLSELYAASGIRLFRAGIIFFTIVIAVLISYNTFDKRNFKNTGEWYYEAHNEEMLEIISKDWNASGRTDPVTISNTWVFAPAINYYRVSKSYTWLQPADKEGFRKADYYICFTNEDSKIPADSLQLLKQFDDFGVAVYREYKPGRISN
jgi:hypothetical protein